MAERDTLAAERAALSAALAAVHESTSWRLTAPMRAIVDMFRRLKSRHDI
jgi:hypothetical protein